MHGPAAHTHTRHNATQINLTLTLTHHCPTLITLDPRHHPPPHWRAARVQLLAVHIVLCYGGGPFTCPLPAGASTCMGGFLVYSGGNEIAEVSASKSKLHMCCVAGIFFVTIWLYIKSCWSTLLMQVVYRCVGKCSCLISLFCLSPLISTIFGVFIRVLLLVVLLDEIVCSLWLSSSLSVPTYELFGLCIFWGWWISSSLSDVYICPLTFSRWQHGHWYAALFCHTFAGIWLSHPGCILCEHVSHSTSSPPFLHFAHTSSRFPLHLFIARFFVGDMIFLVLHARAIFHVSKSVTCCGSCFLLRCFFEATFFFLVCVSLSARLLT